MTCIQDDGGTWSAQHCAVWVEEMANADGTRRVTMLRHPDYPYVQDIAEPGGVPQMEQELRAVALAYIDKVSARAGISEELRDALASSDDTGFRWLDLSWGAGEHQTASRDPRKSYWVMRRPGAAPLDRTVALLAGQRGTDGVSLGAEIGLRVVMHVPTAAQGGARRVRVTGMSMSNLPPPQAIGAINALALHRFGAYLGALNSLFNFISVRIHGAAFLDGDKRLRFFGAGSRGDDSKRTRNYAYVSEIDSGDTDGKTARTLVQLERVSHAAVFEREPASSGNTVELPRRRPTRPSNFLDTYRHTTGRLPPWETDPNGPTGRISLKMDDLMQVRQTRIGNEQADPDKVHSVPVGTLDLRSDNLAAVHAYMRGFELFERLRAYSLDPSEYFKLAKLPLILRHRAPIRGAGDGKTVNAQVRPTGDGLSLLEAWPGPGAGDQRPQLEVRFAGANLAHRRLWLNDAQRLRAQPLGLAADQRWAWHEFSHVLAFASTGALEFRFAHSAGDALAAIVADPDSALALDSYSREGTFPWVHIPRRHARNADASWCWCGRRNVARLSHAAALYERRLGYFQEQLLSSSLFRFYRCIGGDTFSHPDTRRSASDYAVYLIMRAIALLGPENVVPARTADQLVSALIDADIGTGVWAITATWPERAPARNVFRVGGCVHKVLRWAFEMQGLYATEDPFEVIEGPGKPPCVDIYIADRRGGSVGGYDPVKLVWHDVVTQPWHASEQAIVVAARKVTVTVGNRGQTDATNVHVSARVLPAGGPPPWTSLVASTPQPQNVPVGGAVAFEFNASAALPQAPYLVWASATCQADRANDDPAAGLPCDPALTPLVDLIANDNNQGLRLIAN
jgi:hypothetical protein